MGKTPTRSTRRLYLAEWLDALGRTQTEAGKAVGVGQSYIANLIAGRKANPSGLILLLLSEWLGITVNDLYIPPPPDSAVDRMRHLSPGAIDALTRKPRREPSR